MLSSAKILVVDPDPHGRQLIANTLRKDGYTVNEWEDIKDKHDLGRCDVVIVDPTNDPSQPVKAIETLRRRDDFITTSLIVCSSDNSDQMIIDCLDAGADDYIVKPISPATLVARVRSILRRNRTRYA